MSTDPDRPPSIDADSAPQSASIGRRSFSASIGAGLSARLYTRCWAQTCRPPKLRGRIVQRQSCAR